MSDRLELEQHLFPRAGVRARRWQRFAEGFATWLESPDGKFAIWRAQRQLESPLPAASAEAQWASASLRSAERRASAEPPLR